VIRAIAAKLRPGGQFVFSTVVRDGLDARLFGPFWAGFDFPRHMVYFSLSDLQGALHEHFRNVRLVHQAAPIDFERSASWRIAAGKGRALDSLLHAMGQGTAAQLFSLVLASLGMTSRVSVYCERRS
jgi:hypothetical protein